MLESHFDHRCLRLVKLSCIWKLTNVYDIKMCDPRFQISCLFGAIWGPWRIRAGCTAWPAAAARGWRGERATHAWSKQPPSCAFGEPACLFWGYCCRRRRHLERSLSAIATKQNQRKIVTPAAPTWPQTITFEIEFHALIFFWQFWELDQMIFALKFGYFFQRYFFCTRRFVSLLCLFLRAPAHTLLTFWCLGCQFSVWDCCAIPSHHELLNSNSVFSQKPFWGKLISTDNNWLKNNVCSENPPQLQYATTMWLNLHRQKHGATRSGRLGHLWRDVHRLKSNLSPKSLLAFY